MADHGVMMGHGSHKCHIAGVTQGRSKGGGGGFAKFPV